MYEITTAEVFFEAPKYTPKNARTEPEFLLMCKSICCVRISNEQTLQEYLVGFVPLVVLAFQTVLLAFRILASVSTV
jgi:hypothetical protein